MNGKINISLKAKQGVILKRWNYQKLKFQGVSQVAHFSITITIVISKNILYKYQLYKRYIIYIIKFR